MSDETAKLIERLAGWPNIEVIPGVDLNAIRSALSQLDATRAERDEAQRQWKNYEAAAGDMLRERDGLAEALKPFAGLADAFDWTEATKVGGPDLPKALDAARAALSALKHQGAET